MSARSAAMHSSRSKDSTTKQNTRDVIEDLGSVPTGRTLARRACDGCRARRRKCFFASGSPMTAQSPDAVQCYDCERLGIRCSFLIPTRTRGPKRRKHSLDNAPQTRPRADQDATQPLGYSGEVEWQPPRQSHSHVDAYTSRSSRSGTEMNQGTSPISIDQHISPLLDGSVFLTDELCPRSLLNIILNDYLDLIYPLVPVVHRPTLRKQLASHHDTTDPEFLALIVALTGLTIGLLPSRFSYYQSMAPEVASRFKTRTAMINRCIDMCMRQRTATYWDKVSQRKWAVCYLLSVGCIQTGQTNRSRMLEVEAMQIGRLLGIHRISDYEGLNCIEAQLRKKAFWLLFYCYAHAWHQYGRQERLSFLDHFMLHEVNFEALMPLEVDDEQILENEIRATPSSIASPSSTRTSDDLASGPLNLASGFNLHSLVFFKSAKIALTPGNCDWDHHFTPEARLNQLRQLLDEIRYMLDDIPGPLRQWASINDNSAYSSINSPSVDSEAWRRDDTSSEHEYANARALPGQMEIMKANLHGTHLWIQSCVLDRIDIILQEQARRQDPLYNSESSPTPALKASWSEREDVCRQMLHLLHSMPYAYQEPNGLYFTYKVRDVGVALLNCPYEAQQAPARRAAEYMQEFTRALCRLDRSEILNTSSLKSWVDSDREKAFPK